MTGTTEARACEVNERRLERTCLHFGARDRALDGEAPPVGEARAPAALSLEEVADEGESIGG